METKKGLNRTSPETREVYEAPVMETVEVKVEQGFQMSATPSYYDPLKEVYR